MAFSERSLDDYVDVAQRIAEFRAKYPEGSLQPADVTSPWEIATVNGVDKNGEQVAQTFIVYVAAAYRTPDDMRPGIGCAWEIWPGRTPYTRGSELMNAETSAWGRAIVAVLASDSKQGVASRQEVAARRAEREDGLPTNADGSLSRSRTTDAEKDAAGVMTSAQQAEHTALGGGHPNERRTPKDDRAKITRIRSTPAGTAAAGSTPGRGSSAAAPPDDNAWLDRPGMTLAESEYQLARETEREPGSISPQQQRAIHAACKDMERPERLATISDIVGRQVTSSNELSYTEAARVLGKLSAVRP